MLTSEDIEFDVSVTLPEDWQDQIRAIASRHGLEVVTLARQSSHKVQVALKANFSFFDSAFAEDDFERFSAAVELTRDEMAQFLGRPQQGATHEEGSADAGRIEKEDQPRVTWRPRPWWTRIVKLVWVGWLLLTGFWMQGSCYYAYRLEGGVAHPTGGSWGRCGAWSGLEKEACCSEHGGACGCGFGRPICCDGTMNRNCPRRLSWSLGR